MKKLLVLPVIAVAILSLSFSSFAQQESGIANGFKVSPVRIESTIEPGGTYEDTITVSNVNDYDVNAKAIINDFETAVDETGNPRVLFDEGTTSSGNSFKSIAQPIADVNIPANGEVEVPVTLKVPENATAGGYYGVVRFVSGSGNEEFDENVALSASVGTIFIVTVPGDLTEQLELVELTAAKNESTGRFFIGNGDNIQIITRLKNTGNIHVKPFGKVSITDSKGNVVEQFEFNETTPKANVLPDSIRKFTNDVSYSNFFGKYTVTANLGYGNGNGLITAKSSFWVVPLWLVIIAGVAILALVIIAVLIYKKVSKSRKHKVKPRR